MAPSEVSEHQIQSAYFDWAKMHLRARRAYAVPNGGQRNIVVASKLKAEGVRKGVLDIHLPIACGGANGLWLEFKAGRNNLSPEQVLEAQALVADGYAVAVCWDTLAAINITQRYLAGEVGPALMIWR
jgi:hypothetical protein